MIQRRSVVLSKRGLTPDANVSYPPEGEISQRRGEAALDLHSQVHRVSRVIGEACGGQVHPHELEANQHASSARVV